MYILGRGGRVWLSGGWVWLSGWWCCPGSLAIVDTVPRELQLSS